MKRRLYLRLYLTLLGVMALALVVTLTLARAFHEPTGLANRYLAPIARQFACEGPARCQGESAKRLTELARELGIDIVIWDSQGRPLFQAARSPLRLPYPPTAGWHHTPRGGLWLTPLADGRVVGLRERGRLGARGHIFLPLVLGLAVLMAVGLYPLSRGITRRIEQLAEGARRWGEGDLGHRVPVTGKDEIAALAARFNQTAVAIEALLAQERQMLATASHELRSPLARVRMALELLAEETDGDRRVQLARRASDDIAELDALVEELLLTVRTQPGIPRRPMVETDLLALVRDEAEQVSAQVDGEAVCLPCEPAMMRRLLRNLFANARLHGCDTPIRAQVRRDGSSIVIAVEDAGPGVPEAERERIFAPFYRAPGPRPPGDSGIGLGLALCRQVARYHGGEIIYLPRQPTGSRFEVRLPTGA